MSEPKKKSIDGDRIIIRSVDNFVSKKLIFKIESYVDDSDREIVRVTKCDYEAKAGFSAKVFAEIIEVIEIFPKYLFRQKLKNNRIKIERAPGYQMFGFLAKVCPKRFVDRELSALHADGLAMYNERLEAKDFRGAAMVKWSMRGWMLWAVVGGVLSSFLRVFTGKAQSS